MRTARIKLTGESAVYHCISRIVGGQRLLDDRGMEKLVGILRKPAGFCDVRDAGSASGRDQTKTKRTLRQPKRRTAERLADFQQPRTFS